MKFCITSDGKPGGKNTEFDAEQCRTKRTLNSILCGSVIAFGGHYGEPHMHKRNEVKWHIIRQHPIQWITITNHDDYYVCVISPLPPTLLMLVWSDAQIVYRLIIIFEQ